MRVVVVTPPSPVVTWSDANVHLRLDGDTTEQSFVEGLIAAATAHLDGPSGWLGRAIGTQALEARFDNFDCGSLRLPYPEIISIVSAKYIDSSGAEQTIASTGYELLGPSLVPVYGAVWPSPRWQREAVRIQYQAGSATLPAPIRAAILLMVGDLYGNRETTLDARAAGAVPIPMSATVETLLAPFRVWA